MSELDLGATGRQTTTGTAAQPAAAPGGLVLDPPKPVALVKTEEAEGAL